MKKVLSLGLAALLMVGALAGCGNSDGSSDGKGKSGTGTEIDFLTEERIPITLHK